MTFQRSLSALCCLFLLSTQLWAQTYRFRDYQQDSLPFQAVNQVYTADDEQVWLGTDSGLFLFDGANCRSMNRQLKSRTILGFETLAPDSLLFLNHEGIQLLDSSGDQEVITPYMVSESFGYPSGMFRTQSGALWVGYEGGKILRLDSGLGGEDVANSGGEDAAVPKGVGEDQMYTLDPDAGTAPILFSEDGIGQLWALIEGFGLYRYIPQKNTWEKSRPTKALDIAIVEDRMILLSAKDLEVGRIFSDGRLGRWSRSSLPVFAEEIYPLSKEEWLIAGPEGLVLGHWENSRLQVEPVFGSNDPHRIEELPFKNIRSLHAEWEEGQIARIWIATDRGFGMLWKGFFESVPGMPFDNVLSLDRGGGKTARVSMGALYEITGQAFSILEFPEAISGISSNRERVFLGGNAGSLMLLRSGAMQKMMDLTDRGGGIFYLYSDSAGITWFCQAPSDKPLTGVGAIDLNGQLRFYDREHGLESRVLVVGEGGRNELYAAGIGPETYLYKFDRENDRFKNVSLPLPFSISPNFEVHDIAVDSLGLVWLATTDGLLLFDGEFIRRTDLGRYSDYEIRAVSVDPNGGLWAATDTEGLLYLKDEGAPIRFGEQNGMPSRISSYRALNVDKEGRLWMGTAEGLIRSSRLHPLPTATPSPRIENGMAQEALFLELTRDTEASLSARTFAYPADHLTYQYRITPDTYSEEERQGQDWIPAENGQIPVNTDRSGYFILEVRGQQGEGYLWSDPTRLNVRIQNPWYRQLWFYALLTALILMILWLGWKQSLSRRVSGLELALEKQSVSLDEQSDELREQRAKTKSTKTHLYLLERLVRNLPNDLEWDQVWSVFYQVIKLPIPIDRITIYTRSGMELLCTAVSRDEPEPVSRREPFDEKLSLPCHVFTRQHFLYIDDLTDAGQWPVNREMDVEGSLLFIPFRQGSDDLLFSAFSEQKEALTTDDIAILKLLVSFISRSLIKTNE